jgi:hypothetical protein
MRGSTHLSATSSWAQVRTADHAKPGRGLRRKHLVETGGAHVNFVRSQRALLAGLADVLIPAGDGMPSASAAAVAEDGLNQVLAAVPSLGVSLADVLARAEGRDPVEVIASLARSDPAAYGILTEVVTAAYFMNPDVRQAVGYGGQRPSPLDPRVDYMEDGLLESVIKRGPIYRPTPKASR